MTVRENLKKYRKMPLPELLDLSVNETLARTIVTSLSMLITLVALLAFGPEVIFGFTAAITLGIFVGTYSSIYMAAPILIWLKVNPKSFVPTETALEKQERLAREGLMALAFEFRTTTPSSEEEGLFYVLLPILFRGGVGGWPRHARSAPPQPAVNPRQGRGIGFPTEPGGAGRHVRRARLRDQGGQSAGDRGRFARSNAPGRRAVTTSRAPPMSGMTSGVPQASASIHTLASPSRSEGRTMALAPAISTGMKSWPSAPRKWTRCATSNWRASVRRAASSGPVPAMARRTFHAGFGQGLDRQRLSLDRDQRADAGDQRAFGGNESARPGSRARGARAGWKRPWSSPV
jgi:hypothetical protein